MVVFRILVVNDKALNLCDAYFCLSRSFKYLFDFVIRNEAAIYFSVGVKMPDTWRPIAIHSRLAIQWPSLMDYRRHPRFIRWNKFFKVVLVVVVNLITQYAKPGLGNQMLNAKIKAPWTEKGFSLPCDSFGFQLVLTRWLYRLISNPNHVLNAKAPVSRYSNHLDNTALKDWFEERKLSSAHLPHLKKWSS